MKCQVKNEFKWLILRFFLMLRMQKPNRKLLKITGKSQRNGPGNDAAYDWKRHHMLSEMQERKNDNNQKFAKTE